MIRHAQAADIPQLKEIWTKVFGDEEKFINEFFDSAFSEKETLCFEENGRVAAMLYMLPCRIQKKGGGLEKAYYFYALATLGEYRGRGIMGNLIRHARQEIFREGCHTIFLIPASDSLVSYYEKFGFEKILESSAFLLDGKKGVRALEAYTGGKLEEAAPDELKSLVSREWNYTNRNVFFSDKMEDFYLKQSISEKSCFFKALRKNGKSIGYLEGTFQDGDLRISNYGMEIPFPENDGELQISEQKGHKIAINSTGIWEHIQGFIPQ